MMNEKEILAKLNSSTAEKIFSDLYGENEIEAARRRYSSLIREFFQNKDDFTQTTENIRFFSAPGRTELAGNHTDHNRGKVLAASIQMDNAALVTERKDNLVFFRSAGYPDVKVKLKDSSGAMDLNPKPEEEGTTEALVRGIASEINRRNKEHGGMAIGGFSANAESTVLPGSGLSSSAAVEVLIGLVFDCLYGEGKRGPVEIAQIGQIAENSFFGKPCGLMDQIASASGGAAAIDFADEKNPKVRRISFNPESAGYALCIVNTGGNHADLTSDYAAIPAEMKKVASFFGKQALAQTEKLNILLCAADLRKNFGDRALLRALHFFDENERVDIMMSALTKMEGAASDHERQNALAHYLEMVNESGDSSWKYLQNAYSPHHPEEQGISAALALTKEFFSKQRINGACRVHGGGFAGTIQVYLPIDAMNSYRQNIENVFGDNSLTKLRIRPIGAVELIF